MCESFLKALLCVHCFAFFCFLPCFVVTDSRAVGGGSWREADTSVTCNGFWGRWVRECIAKAFLNVFPKRFGRAKEKVTNRTGSRNLSLGIGDFGPLDFGT